MIEYFPFVGAALTLALGILGLALPNAVAEMVGIEARSPLARSEVRATYGGLFIGLGAACLWFQSTEAFLVAGVSWGAAAAARVIAMVLEQGASRKNIAGVFVEGGIGGLLLCTLL